MPTGRERQHAGHSPSRGHSGPLERGRGGIGPDVRVQLLGVVAHKPRTWRPGVGALAGGWPLGVAIVAGVSGEAYCAIAQGVSAETWVPLTSMFRHLREDALAVLGGGTAAFMRLGHHAEADQAASYLGHQRRQRNPQPYRHRRLRRAD
jgi:hypothetical protein